MQTINIDLSMRSVIPVLYAKQGDVGRKFKAILIDGGVAYPVPGGAAVSVWYSGASGEGNYTDIGAQSAISVSGNEITVELITQMLTNPGAGTVCLVINTADGDELGTWNINYCVEPRPGMNSAEAQAYFTAFSNAVQNLPYPDASLTIPGKSADAAATGAALAGRAPALTEKFSPAYASRNPTLNDLINIDTSGNFESGNMHRSYIGTEDASTLMNCPVSGGAFYAIRGVESVTNPYGGYHTMVTIKEFYPVQGRKWYRMYDINQKAWLPLNGWREENTDAKADNHVLEALESKVNTQRTYVVCGMFVNDPTTTGGGIRGTGSASINIDSNGLARIDFAVMIEQAGIANENAYNYGINRDMFMLINPNIPTITPKPGGIVTFYNYDGTINNDLTGFGGIFEVTGSFWSPARVYDKDDVYGLIGGWEQEVLLQGMRLVGTCYGTVNL